MTLAAAGVRVWQHSTVHAWRGSCMAPIRGSVLPLSANASDLASPDVLLGSVVSPVLTVSPSASTSPVVGTLLEAD
jgi:hypothetical protein